mgnify:FL=1
MTTVGSMDRHEAAIRVMTNATVSSGREDTKCGAITEIRTQSDAAPITAFALGAETTIA